MIRLITKRCPHCDCVLPSSKLLTLDPYTPSLCDDCGGLIKNTHLRELLAAFVPILITVGMVFLVRLFRRYPEFSVVLVFLLWPFLQTMLARPVKVEIVGSPCLRCKRLDVGFRTPYDRVCDECLTRKE